MISKKRLQEIAKLYNKVGDELTMLKLDITSETFKRYLNEMYRQGIIEAPESYKECARKSGYTTNKTQNGDREGKHILSTEDIIPLFNLDKAIKEGQDTVRIWNELTKEPKVYREVIENRNVLVIGDLHAPFIKEGYLEFCKEMYIKYNCTDVIFIGDLIDNHFTSFHTIDPDGHGAGMELSKAIKQLGEWYKAFPKAKVCLGNHDLIPNRKAMNAGISDRWVKKIGDVLMTPGWEFSERFVIDDVQYVHGTGRKCRPRTKSDLMSTVQGHYHSESYVEHLVGSRYKIFAMQVGCGVEQDSYAMAYGKHFSKMVIGCGLVLNNGTLPTIELMNL